MPAGQPPGRELVAGVVVVPVVVPVLGLVEAVL